MEDAASDYLRAILGKDVAKAESIVMARVERSDDLIGVFDLLGKAQTQIGDLWERKIISVADEQFATRVALGLISKLSKRFRPTGRAIGHAVAFSCEGEFHEVGLQIFSALLGIHGWKVDILGTDINASRALEALKTTKPPDLLCVSITMEFNLQALAEALRSLRRHPQLGSARVIIGGHLFKSNVARELFAETVDGRKLADCVAWNIKSGLEYVRSLGQHGT